MASAILVVLNTRLTLLYLVSLKVREGDVNDDTRVQVCYTNNCSSLPTESENEFEGEKVL